MHRKIIVLCTGLALLVLGVGFMTAQDKTAKDLKREADKQAIDKLAKDMTLAFEKRDAAALAVRFTSPANCQPATGSTDCSRAAHDANFP